MAADPVPRPAGSRLQADIIRGVRWAAILLAILLMGITVIRVLHSTPATAAEPKEKPPILVPAKEAGAPVQAVVPEPPPAIAPRENRNGSRENALRKGSGGVENSVQAIDASPLSTPPASPDKSTDSRPISIPGAAVSNFVAPPVSSPVPVSIPPAAMPGAIPSSAVTHDSSGNSAVRAIKSVGRVFGVGRKRETPAKTDQPTSGH